MRRIFKVLVCGVLMGFSIPVTVSFLNVYLLLGGVVVGVVFGLVYFALFSRLPSGNPLVKSVVLGLFLLFLPTYAGVSYIESMFLFPPEVASTTWLFYLKSSVYFASFMLIPSIVFGLGYWILSEPIKFKEKLTTNG